MIHLIEFFALVIEVSVAAVFLEEPRAHHGGNREGDHHGYGDGDRKNHREFTEQAPHHAAHHQDGNEDGDERDAHRQNGETDLFARP